MGLAALLLIAACGMKGSSRLGVRDASSRSRHAPALLAVDTPLSSRHSRKISLPANADEKTLKKAFKQLAIELHPDISGGDAEAAAKFAEISAEYSRLLKQARKDQSFHSPNRVLAMVALAAAALYGTTEDPVLPVVLFAAGSWISTILTEERKPPRQLTMARDLLAQGEKAQTGLEDFVANATVTSLSIFAAVINAAVDAAIGGSKRGTNDARDESAGEVRTQTTVDSPSNGGLNCTPATHANVKAEPKSANSTEFEEAASKSKESVQTMADNFSRQLDAHPGSVQATREDMGTARALHKSLKKGNCEQVVSGRPAIPKPSSTQERNATIGSTKAFEEATQKRRSKHVASTPPNSQNSKVEPSNAEAEGAVSLATKARNNTILGHAVVNSPTRTSPKRTTKDERNTTGRARDAHEVLDQAATNQTGLMEASAVKEDCGASSNTMEGQKPSDVVAILQRAVRETQQGASARKGEAADTSDRIERALAAALAAEAKLERALRAREEANALRVKKSQQDEMVGNEAVADRQIERAMAAALSAEAKLERALLAREEANALRAGLGDAKAPATSPRRRRRR